MSDPFFKQPNNIDSPAKNAIVVVPSDVADQGTSYKALYIGGSGDVKCETVGSTAGSFVTFTGLVAGSILPVRIRKIYATGTTATNMIGLY